MSNTAIYAWLLAYLMAFYEGLYLLLAAIF